MKAKNENPPTQMLRVKEQKKKAEKKGEEEKKRRKSGGKEQKWEREKKIKDPNIEAR